MALSKKTIEIVTATAGAVAANGVAIVDEFYHELFKAHPECEIKFPHSHHIAVRPEAVLVPGCPAGSDGTVAALHEKTTGRQQHALLDSIVAYASNIDHLERLGPTVERIAHKHVAFAIPADMYPTIGVELLGAVKDVLGDAATDEVLAAWKEAYFFLADVLIGAERDLRESTERRPGGWSGWKSFVVDHKERDADEGQDVVHFYLKSEDGGPLLGYDAGQSIALRFTDLPAHDGPFAIRKRTEEIRQYTLSRAPEADPGRYRITVRLEAGHEGPEGLVSGHMIRHLDVGDTVQITPPTGTHTLERALSGQVSEDGPIVLAGSGIGVTSAFALFDAACRRGLNREVDFVQIVRDGKHRVMQTEIREAAARHPGSKIVFVHTNPASGEVRGVDYDVAGTDFREIKAALSVDKTSAQYHFTGPAGFMDHAREFLLSQGVRADQLYYEAYGPTQ